MSEDTPETILNKIVAVLEEHTMILDKHTTILQSHRQNFEHLGREFARVNEEVRKLQAGASPNSNDAKFVAEMNERLKVILNMLQEKT